MKALSVKQPWAGMIASGMKTIETRTWPTPYRGDLLIVSSKRPAGIGPSGVSLCIVRLVDCRRMIPFDESEACCECYESAWAWCLEDVRSVEQRSVRGSLGIYGVDDSLVVTLP